MIGQVVLRWLAGCLSWEVPVSLAAPRLAGHLWWTEAQGGFQSCLGLCWGWGSMTQPGYRDMSP